MGTEGDRELWLHVLLQARQDIEAEPIGSLVYDDAAAWLTSHAAYWRRARESVAEHIGTTGETIRHLGAAWVAARRRAEGLPEEPPAPRQRSVPPPPEPAPLVIPLRLEAELKASRRRRPPERNPFYPRFAA